MPRTSGNEIKLAIVKKIMRDGGRVIIKKEQTRTIIYIHKRKTYAKSKNPA